MSAYSASKIMRARKSHRCDKCDQTIPAATRYLRYELAHGVSYALHLDCATGRSENGSLVHDCADLREWLEIAPPLPIGPLHPDMVSRSAP